MLDTTEDLDAPVQLNEIAKITPAQPTPESNTKHSPGFIMTKQSSLSKKISKLKSSGSGPAPKIALSRVFSTSSLSLPSYIRNR